MIKTLFRKVLKGDPLKSNESIKERIKNFKRTIPQANINSYRRPKDWQKSIEIIVPCYNHAKYLNAAFNSIRKQSYRKPLSVTFINDASTDNSLNVMQRIKGSNTESRLKIKIINNDKNLLQGGSINKAVADSKNQLFIILNADDLLTPDCLDLIVATYNNHPDIAMLGGSSIWFSNSRKLPKFTPKNISDLKLKKYGPKDAVHFTKLNDINMSQSSCSFFKPAWELVGGYFDRQDRVCEFDDRDFQMRVCSVLPIGIYENYPMEFYRTVSSQGKATI